MRAGLLGFAVALSASLTAFAAPRHVQLVWTRGPGADRCPDDQQVRQAVAARLGYPPFEDNAETIVTARLEQREPALVGTIEVMRTDGTFLGRRELSSVAGDCAELAASMQLAIAIAIDPQYLRRTAAPVSPVAPLVPEPPPAPAPSQLHLTLSAGAIASAGLAPQLAPGITLRLAVEWPRFSVGLEARADFASASGLAGGSVKTSVLLGSASPCVRVWRIDACGQVSAGALQVTSNFTGAELRQSTPLVLAGARAQLPWQISDYLSIRLFLGAQAVLTRTSLLSGADTVWVTPPICGELGISLGVRFF